MNLLGIFARKPPPPARFPDGRVGYAVGDIHGRLDLLKLLCERLEAAAAADSRTAGAPIVVFLGDYVDRGPESAGVIDFLLGQRPAGFERRFLRGNHEQSMQAFMADPMGNRAWLMQGGAETLSSYGVSPPSPLGASEADWQAAAAALRERVPAAHVAFLDRLERYVALGGYAFVHAGVHPARPLEAQTDQDLYWIRERFLNDPRPYAYRVVHGHTPADRPFADARRVGVDTGAYATGVLTAARFEGEDVTFISVGQGARGAAS